VINHLLGGNERAYDFLVYDESDTKSPKRMLRKSLRTHFEELDISTEHLITVEYFLSLPRPSDGGKLDSDEWIGSVAGMKDTSGAGMFVYGSYSGALNVVSGDEKNICSVGAHEGAVKAVACDGDVIVSGGHDKTLRTWKFTSSQSLIPVLFIF
jgi:WD40 repeat protein